MTLLLLAVWQLTRWLGRGSAIGLVVGLTPMAVFHLSTASTVGLEIVGAAAVGAVLITTTRWPESLVNRGSLVVLAARRVGVDPVETDRRADLRLDRADRALPRGRTRCCGGNCAEAAPRSSSPARSSPVDAVAIVVWERLFDNPALTGTLFDAQAWGNFVDTSFLYMRTGIGYFGWNDTVLPGPFMGLWILLLLVTVGAGALVARRSDMWTMVVILLAVGVTAYAIAAIIFWPIGGGCRAGT